MPVRRLTLVGVVLVVAAQIAVPVWGLFREAPRFGWQMYDGGRPSPEFVVVGRGGVREPVDDSDFIANRRTEVRYEDHLPSLLCERFADARYVLVTREPLDFRERVRCSGG